MPTTAFSDHVFGVLPLNDWSARDIQAWEYVPLGPFLGKSFATSISGWVTPLDGLESARVDLPGQEPAPLEYLRVDGPAGYDIAFEVVLNGERSPAAVRLDVLVPRPDARAPDRQRRLPADRRPLRQRQRSAVPSATSGARSSSCRWGGTEPFGPTDRTFLEDGDTVTLRATAPGRTAGGSRSARSRARSCRPDDVAVGAALVHPSSKDPRHTLLLVDSGRRSWARRNASGFSPIHCMVAR